MLAKQCWQTFAVYRRIILRDEDKGSWENRDILLYEMQTKSAGQKITYYSAYEDKAWWQNKDLLF